MILAFTFTYLNTTVPVLITFSLTFEPSTFHRLGRILELWPPETVNQLFRTTYPSLDWHVTRIISYCIPNAIVANQPTLFCVVSYGKRVFIFT